MIKRINKTLERYITNEVDTSMLLTSNQFLFYTSTTAVHTYRKNYLQKKKYKRKKDPIAVWHLMPPRYFHRIDVLFFLPSLVFYHLCI